MGTQNMNREPVRSSDLRSVGYDLSNSILEVEFHGGRIYHYFKVPLEIYDALMNAPSKGTFLDRNVKKRGFAYRQIR
jgi:hypothetical protein